MHLRQVAFGLAALIASHPLSIRANSFDDSVLLRDIGNVLTLDSSGRLFASGEVSQLRRLLQFRDIAQVDRVVARKALIEVTINPEARVSVLRTGASLPSFACGAAEPVLVRVINQGHITSNLEMRPLAESETSMVTLGQLTPHLSGAAVEYRLLTLTVDAVHPIDFTLTVNAGPGTDDLGLRSRLSLMVKCSAK